MAIAPETSPTDRVCYVVEIEASDGEKLRFGFSKRLEAQVVVTRLAWKKVYDKLRRAGYRIVHDREQQSVLSHTTTSEVAGRPGVFSCSATGNQGKP